MLDYKIIEYIRKKINLINLNFNQKDLETLIKNILKAKRNIKTDDFYKNAHFLNLLKFSIRRRLSGEPISQIVGFKDFWNSKFYINENVLDPRPETELIVEKVLEISKENLSILDLGTGSGCLAISIALERPNFEIFASDISNDALTIAKFNSKTHKTAVTFIKSDWFSDIDRSFDVIISNPPYVSEMEYNKLPLGIRRFEPKIALHAGYKGLDCFKKIIKEFFYYLKPDGLLIMEIGYNQKKSIKDLFHFYGFKKIEIFKDLSKKYRIVCVKKDAI